MPTRPKKARSKKVDPSPPAPSHAVDVWTVHDVAAYLRTTPRAIRHRVWNHEGFPTPNMDGQCWTFERIEVVAYRARKKAQAREQIAAARREAV